jgi:hypothetical protein
LPVPKKLIEVDSKATLIDGFEVRDCGSCHAHCLAS